MKDPLRRTRETAAPTILSVLAGLLVFQVLSPRRAWGYIDPLTGSIVLQVLAAAFLAATAAFRRFRRWVTLPLRKLGRLLLAPFSRGSEVDRGDGQ